MSDVLSRLSAPEGARKAERRVGRGPGSSQGKTCGRGMKGQKARNGGNIGKLHFQGGQTPIQRRLPKRGFRVPFPVETIAINVGQLERFDAGQSVDEETLRGVRLVQKTGARIKILGGGELTKKLTVSANRFSESAKQKIEAVGGTIVVVPEGPPPADQAATA
jgi:large subunit ribosomal protein L15